MTDGAIPAATLILYRESTGDTEHLLMERTRNMKFAAGALVFPGGRVEDDDHVVARDPECVAPAGDADDLPFRVTAIRETLEEAGVWVGTKTSPAHDLLSEWRSALKEGEAFSALLRAAGVKLDLSLLLPWARWNPKLEVSRRFDTRFYIAKYEDDHALDPDVDEAINPLWISASDAIAGAQAERFKIIFPTLRNLERLAAYPDFNAASGHLDQVPVRTISPSIEEDDAGTQWLCIPNDCGYPVTRQLLSEVMKP